MRLKPRGSWPAAPGESGQVVKLPPRMRTVRRRQSAASRTEGKPCRPSNNRGESTVRR